MSDAPMSRRARRALEEQAAERMAQENLGVTAGPGATPPVTGDVPLSRRDRRRLERLQRPMETWTAEEEMIATGQIPVLTPERIAEQERLAREKAEQAARDAELASHELRRIAQHEIAPGSEFAARQPEVTPTPGEGFAVAPTPQSTPTPGEGFAVAPTPQSTPTPGEGFAVAPTPAPQPFVEPEPEPFFEPVPVAEPEPFVQPAPVVEQAPTPDAGFAQAPVQESAPEPVDEPFTPVFQFEPIKPPQARDEAQPVQPQPFADIFPPGSVQAGIAAQAVPTSGATPLPEVTEPAQPESALAPQPDVTSGIDEIRRLAAEAMSGIERAGQVSQPEPAPFTPASGAFQQVSQPEPAPFTPASGAFQQVSQPEPAPFTPASGAFQQVSQPEPAPQAEANPWDLHPLEQAPAPQADPNDFTPVAAPVQPDFSALYQTAPQQPTPFAPVTGTSPTVPPSAVLPTSGQFPTSPFGSVSPTTSGQIPTESLATGTFRRPEIPAGPGPRDFKWLHLGVIGALMFVLGVFIYNVAFNQ